MNEKQVSPFSQQLIGMLMEGVELPAHIVDAINSYYKTGAERAPLQGMQQSSQMQSAQPQISPQMLRNLLMQPGGQGTPRQPTQPFERMNERMTGSFPMMQQNQLPTAQPPMSMNQRKPMGPMMPNVVGPLKGY